MLLCSAVKKCVYTYIEIFISCIQIVFQDKITLISLALINE